MFKSMAAPAGVGGRRRHRLGGMTEIPPTWLLPPQPASLARIMIRSAGGPGPGRSAGNSARPGEPGRRSCGHRDRDWHTRTRPDRGGRLALVFHWRSGQ
jgi:hypothetical protein